MSKDEIEQTVSKLVEQEPPGFDQIDYGEPVDFTKWRRGARANSMGTSLRGYIDTSYDSLVAAFGEPELLEESGRKVDAEWIIILPTGTVMTIYNWKDGPNYLGDEGTLVKEIRDWHIGGKRFEVGEIQDLLSHMGFVFIPDTFIG